MIIRRKSKVIKIGRVKIGGNNPIAIQSMLKAKASGLGPALKQVKDLERVGCEILRVAVKDSKDAQAIKTLKKYTKMPVVADIHFHWQLAIEAIGSGADKIRLNPGNIYETGQVKEIARAAKAAGIPIRVGVNSGSLSLRKVSASQGHRRQADLMVKSALDYIKILEKLKFYDIVVSLKGSNIFDTMEAYRKISRLCDYPLHLGVTATGATYSGGIKSAIAIGALLLEGIGDTIRVSLTDTPEQEIRAAKAILEAVEARNFGAQIISCPTCGRCEVDLIGIVNKLEGQLTGRQTGRQSGRPLKVAVMGCVVNGPGEARGADIGIAFGKKDGMLFQNKKALRKVSFGRCLGILSKEIKKHNG